MEGRARALANYPHARQVGNQIYISGISSRNFDDTVEGCTEVDGEYVLDIAVQTRAVIKNIEAILANCGCTLDDLVDLTVFLVNMKDYKKFNDVYNEFFDAATGPARTTIGVRELPSPKLLIEIKSLAVKK